jgi:ubiquinone/menaquinone biosynthesis C-methylase UbiE
MNNQVKFETSQGGAGDASSKDEIRQFFNDMSSGRNKAIQANPVISYEQELRAETVLGLLAVKRGERVLDIGCGNARDIARIAACGGHVIGVDISEGMVAAARQEVERMGGNEITLQVGDATRLDFPDASFDKVLCSEVIEHIPDAPQALREMHRVLKPGGTLVLSTPNKGSWYGFERYWLWEKLLRRKWPHPCDVWRSMSELLALVEQGRFKVSERRSVCFVPGFLVSYFILPSLMQRLLVKMVGKLEPFLQRWLQNSGYTICVRATRAIE